MGANRIGMLVSNLRLGNDEFAVKRFETRVASVLGDIHLPSAEELKRRCSLRDYGQ